MSAKRKSLEAAHKGYIYQDIASAYFLAEAVIHQFDSVTVDRKEYEGDLFDDVTIRSRDRVIRRQLKYSSKPGRSFEKADLITNRENLRIDELVRCYKNAGASPADEYRLCTTWTLPTNPEFLSMLEPVSTTPSFTGHPSRQYRLRIESIWPDDTEAMWEPLRTAFDLTRQDFQDFSSRFIIELNCPPASFDLTNPGHLEKLLLHRLTDGIGIGKYPNKHRSDRDVAAYLIHFASWARAKSLVVRPIQIIRHLRIRTDYGRIAQEFPIDESINIERQDFLHELIEQSRSQRFIVLTGEPGAGKSWILTQLANLLFEAGEIVARHYCYLEPGDPWAQQRITTNQLFANLVAGLIETEPSLREKHRPIYATGPLELEKLLKILSESMPSKRIYLIVDGVDHVSRVFQEAPSLSADDIDIVEKLAALDCPDNVCLIVGSQPGIHVAPLLEKATELTIPIWTPEEVRALAQRLGTVEALQRRGFGHQERTFLAELAERSEGNPLYATFVCRDIKGRLTSEEFVDPMALLRTFPVYEGDLSNYYRHLFRTAESGSEIVLAEILGLVDFGLTESELTEIYPEHAHRTPNALSYLQPILKVVSAQGGVRIYHESFRRFIREILIERGASAAEIMKPLINWLASRDFYHETNTYRFLLPSLRRASRNEDIIELVDTKFVSASIAAGNPRQAIEQNLELAVEVAAEELDWPTLARLAELKRSVQTCFDEKLQDIEQFGRSFAAVYSAAALCERLLFDGRPTFPVEEGTILCALCDDLGENPPWIEYLKIKTEDDETRRDKELEPFYISRFKGLLRIHGVEAMSQRLQSWMEDIEEPPRSYLQGLLREIAKTNGLQVLERLAVSPNLSPKTSCLTKIEYARALMSGGRILKASQIARDALAVCTGTVDLLECLRLGVPDNEVARVCPDLNNLDIGVDREIHHISDEFAVESWVAGVRILAATNPSPLNAQLSRIEGEGWYRAWLRFVVALARVEVVATEDPIGAEEEIAAAFEELASDTCPFKGTPRACDLYSIHSLIHHSIESALRLLTQFDKWPKALSSLIKISEGTTSYLQGYPTGPLVSEALVKILLYFCDNETVGENILEIIKGRAKRTEETGEFYEYQATHKMYLAEVCAQLGKDAEARTHWENAAVNLAAYGYRKDITIYEVIENIQALSKIDLSRARSSISALQPLVNAVVEHTDGRDTQGVPVSWFKELCEVDQSSAIQILTHSLTQGGGLIDWRLEESVEVVINSLRQVGDPALLAFLESTIPFSGSTEDAQRRLAVIERLLDQNPTTGEHFLRLLIAQLQGDSVKFHPFALAEARKLATKRGISIPEVNGVIDFEDRDPGDKVARLKRDPLPIFKASPYFDTTATPLEMMRELGPSSQISTTYEERDYSRFVNAFGYRLLELLQNGKKEEANRLLRYYARRRHFYDEATPLADIGKGLERHGYPDLATIAFALAYSRSRGKGGWSVLGDAAYHHWFEHAMDLSRENALGVLAGEVAYILNTSSYVTGITQHLAELFSSLDEAETAYNIWEAGFGVIDHRLPKPSYLTGLFLRYEPGAYSPLSENEGLLLLLLARVSHPEVKRKATAIAGFAHIVLTDPDLVVEPLRDAIRLNSSLTSTMLILQVLLAFEKEPYIISTSLSDELETLAICEMFGLSVLAKFLIQRSQQNEKIWTRRLIILPTERLNSDEEHATLSLDWGDRVDKIGRYWPEFPRLVASRFDELWKSTDVHKSRTEFIYSAFHSHVHPKLPRAKFIGRHREIFECALHGVLNHLEEILWQEGTWTPEVQQQVAQLVHSDVSLHIACWNSRTTRPPLPLPSAQANATQEIFALGPDDEYEGWFRCGYIEEELLFEGVGLRDYVGKVEVLAGIEFLSFQTEVPEGTLPFGKANKHTWWNIKSLSPIIVETGFTGPLIDLLLTYDTLGIIQVLSLPENHVTRIGLRPGKQPGPLALVDQEGAPAVISRYWRVHPVGYDLSEEKPRLEGSDIIVRPDVFRQLLDICNYNPIERRVVRRSSPSDVQEGEG